METGLQRPLGKGQGHFKCIKSKGQTASNMFFEVTKVHMFLFVLTVSLNMTNSLFSIIFDVYVETGLQRPLGKGQGHFKCTKSKGQTASNMFFEVTKVHMFLFVLTVSLNMTNSLFSIIFDVYVETGLQRPLGKGQGHFKCIKSKGQTASNMFFEVTKVHMFLFVLTVSLNMTNSLFSIILTSMWKQGCSASWGRVRGILGALNPKVGQQATCFLCSLRCTCFYLSLLWPCT